MEFFENKDLNTFANLITKLDGGEFIGLAKMLCVRVFKEDAVDIKGKPAPRKAEDMIVDCLTAFAALNRKQRRDILKVLRTATSKPKRGDK